MTAEPLRPEPSRRQALGILGAALLAAGCAPGPELRIAVPWSGLELERFHQVLAAYGKRVTVFSAGDFIGALLDNPVAAAATPDVAIVNRPDLIAAACDRIKEPPSEKTSGRPAYSVNPAWSELLACGPGGVPKAVWFKVAHKSLIWTRGDPLGLRPGTPARWADWVAYLRGRPRGRRPVLSIGAADGWVLTDWFENVLLGHDVEAYELLLSSGTDRGVWDTARVHDAVTGALGRLKDLWEIPGIFHGGGARALRTTFHDSILDVFYHGHADLVAMGDFAFPLIESYGRWPGRAFRFPTGGVRTPVMVGGDAAVALTEAGTDFITWVRGTVSREGMRAWARQGGFISLDRAVGGRWVPDLAQIHSGDIAFDLSDHLSGGLSGDSGRGLSRILTRFFKEVTGVEGDPADAVANAWADIRRAGLGVAR